MYENVLVIPKSICRFNNGFNKADRQEVFDLIINYGKFLERGIAEFDFDNYQIIPYVVIKKGDKIFYTKRLKKQVETRLHERLSIGVGGHINDIDDNLDDIVLKGLERELMEELLPFPHSEPVFIGTLKDHSNEVGMVHLGLVFYIEAYDEVKIKEVNKMCGSFTDLNFLKCREVFKKLESWSKILVDDYDLVCQYVEEKNK